MRICWSQTLFLLLVIVLGTGSMLSGCGKKGPLYLPQPQQDPQQQTEPTRPSSP
jgi:predicted small lipoprotein YifL